jgi:hypothetical protein
MKKNSSKIRAFVFANTPILQNSSTPKRFAPAPAKPLNSDLALSTRFSMLNEHKNFFTDKITTLQQSAVGIYPIFLIPVDYQEAISG